MLACSPQNNRPWDKDLDVTLEGDSSGRKWASGGDRSRGRVCQWRGTTVWRKDSTPLETLGDVWGKCQNSSKEGQGNKAFILCHISQLPPGTSGLLLRKTQVRTTVSDRLDRLRESSWGRVSSPYLTQISRILYYFHSLPIELGSKQEPCIVIG